MRSALLPSSDMVLQLYELRLWVFFYFSCSLVPIWFRLDQYQRRDWCSYRAVRGRVRLVCHRGICSKTHVEEGRRKKKIELLKESLSDNRIFFLTLFVFLFFSNPGFALITMNTHFICCILFKYTSVKTARLFLHSFWGVASRVSDTFLDLFNPLESRKKCRCVFFYLDEEGAMRKYRGSKWPRETFAGPPPVPWGQNL